MGEVNWIKCDEIPMELPEHPIESSINKFICSNCNKPYIEKDKEQAELGLAGCKMIC
jgi:hypothetical protein